MESIFEEKKLELQYLNVGENRARKQTLTNVKQRATIEDMATFGTLMGQLAPEEEGINSIFIVEKQRIDI